LSTTPNPTEQCARLRSALLNLHRTLIALERREYEKFHGRTSSGDFLQVVAFDDCMKWLEPLSRLIVMLDEALDPARDAGLTPAVVSARLRELLSLDRSREDEFIQRYLRHFDTAPDLAVEHAAVLKALSAAT